jgi:hypothetical protein
MAQTIPNSGFETWIDAGNWHLDPENWETNNTHIMTPVFPDSNSYSGNYSLTISHDYSGITGYAKSRFPYNANASAIKVYVRCEISIMDTVCIQVDLYSKGQTVGDGKWTSTGSIPEWTLINIPITQKYPEADSLEIQIIGGDSLQTSFSVDEISYDLFSGIDTYTRPVCNIYPNPFKEKLNYELPGIDDNQLILFEIIDNYGRSIASIDKYTNQGELNLSNIPGGTYIVKIKTNQEALTKIVIKGSVQ